VVPAEIARGRIVEMKALRSGKMFRVVVKRDGLVVATMPGSGWIAV
jgi:hypothetical protein